MFDENDLMRKTDRLAARIVHVADAIRSRAVGIQISFRNEAREREYAADTIGLPTWVQRGIIGLICIAQRLGRFIVHGI